MRATRSKEAMSIHEQAQVIRETRQILQKFSKKRGNLIPILQEVQHKLGYLPREAMLEISHILDMPEIDIYGVATFYNQFRFNPPGKHSVRVCLGTACHMKGGYITLDAWKRRLGIECGETTPDREFDLDTVACVGCCTMAPVTLLDDKPRDRVDTLKVDGMLLAFKPENPERDDENF